MSNFVSDFIESRSKFCVEMLCQMQMESAYNFALRFLILFKIKRVELYLEVSDSDITATIQNQNLCGMNIIFKGKTQTKPKAKYTDQKCGIFFFDNKQTWF